MIPIVKTLMKSMFRRSATVAYPLKPKQNDPLVRGHVGIEIERCTFCGLCQRRCPTDAIEVIRPEQSWAIARLQCILCNCCVEACPKKCLHMDCGLPPASTEKTRDVVKNARVSVDPTDR